MEGKRSSSLRRWKELRRARHAICYSILALFWAILVMTCFLTREARLPADHSTAADQNTHPNELFLASSSSDVGNSGGSGSIRPEVQEEINWVMVKEAHRVVQDDNAEKPYNLMNSPPTVGLSVSQGDSDLSSSLRIRLRKSYKGSSGETQDLSEAEAVEEENKNDRILLRQNSSRANEDQDQGQLGGVVTEYSDGVDKLQAKNVTLKDLLVAYQPLMVKDHEACATVEEMGSATVGDTKQGSLRLRRMIRSYFMEHGADRVRQLPSNLFCERSFVLGKALEDGFGNNIYKLLTAAGLGMILNRSLIIAESGATNPAYLGKNRSRLRLPFWDYISYTDQAFSMREVKQLWVEHDCAGQHKRPLVLKIDEFANPAHSTSLCEDWTKWTYPILWFKDTQDTVALQFLLKNQHLNLRFAATMVLGDPSKPDFRPNTFGELMMAFVKPKPEVTEAVEWALGRQLDSNKGLRSESPDVALHLRMRQSSSKAALEAAISCITRILTEVLGITHRKPRMVVVSDTPSVLAFMKKSSLALSVDIVSFDYEEFMKASSISSEFSLRADTLLPSAKRTRDWGPLPRWVAVVDFYLAARARHAVVTGADHRVGTTYAQLVASLAAAYTLEDEEEGEQHLQQPARFYSSFQESLLVQGLTSQGGWGHTWRPFGGKLSCPNQPAQCAITPLLPYAWWDAPLQSPNHRDQVKMRRWGIVVESDGEVTDESVQRFCRHRKNSTSEAVLLALPKATI